MVRTVEGRASFLKSSDDRTVFRLRIRLRRFLFSCIAEEQYFNADLAFGPCSDFQLPIRYRYPFSKTKLRRLNANHPTYSNIKQIKLSHFKKFTTVLFDSVAMAKSKYGSLGAGAGSGKMTLLQRWAAILKNVSFKAIQIRNFWEKNRIKRYNFFSQNFCHRWSDTDF